MPRAHAPQKDYIGYDIDTFFHAPAGGISKGYVGIFGFTSVINGLGSVRRWVSAGRALSVAMALVVIYRTLLKFQILTQQIVAEPVQILIHHRMILSRLRDGMAHARIDKKFHGYAPFFQSSVQFGRI